MLCKYIKTTLDALRDRFPRSQAPNPFEPIPQLKQFHAQVHALKDTGFYQSTYFLKLCRRADWYMVDPVLLEFTYLLFKEARKRDFPIYVHTAHRSHSLQLKLYQMGHSTVRSGAHQRGAAIDVVHGHHHWQMPDAGWRYLGTLGEHIIRQNSLPIQWGGRFKTFPDPAHWELKEWRKRPLVDDRDHEFVERSPFKTLNAWEHKDV